MLGFSGREFKRGFLTTLGVERACRGGLYRRKSSCINPLPKKGDLEVEPLEIGELPVAPTVNCR